MFLWKCSFGSFDDSLVYSHKVDEKMKDAAQNFETNNEDYQYRMMLNQVLEDTKTLFLV